MRVPCTVLLETYRSLFLFLARLFSACGLIQKKKKKEGRKMMDSYIQKALKDKSADCRSLMSSLLCVDPARRVLMSDVLKHPWVALGRPNGLPQRRQVAEKSTPVQHLTPQKLSRMTPLTPQEMRHVRRLDPEQVRGRNAILGLEAMRKEKDIY